MRCVGCDRTIPRSGHGAFSYTCICGSTIFYNDTTANTEIMAPGSLIRTIRNNRTSVAHKPLPHLDFLIGESPHTSAIKEQLTKELLEAGAIWISDCCECRENGNYTRHVERQKYLAIQEAEAQLRRGKDA